ncbi:bifunctional proline dehydrogenase/L-glutamate gamma-semialdehyde dehydrogenase [Puniceicoccales bacterium CK1056]|uniref:L-glutamate gamma-semialdehyde dehydrogenase n=1 Tax=Oceanipulchritudo coccoides TaxID=2706888 RepID=A0A6B2M5Q6_9BACT|nr:proline dehydrogenase family protein [Oceanipulchritudo coccoides]NDV63489.1 bifunctional proline dehydrogenase/L-glutamate gamma-semialdehyde dehydrogenase [Oceanipulchritudo coccoides]
MVRVQLDETLLEDRIQELGRECFEEIRGQKLSLMDPKAYTGKLMNWAMEDPDFRVALFRFVDVLPGLTDSASVIRHAQAYFKPVAGRLPGLLQWGLDLDPESLRAKAAAALIRRQISSLGQQFIVGGTPAEAIRRLKKIHAKGMCTTVDLLGEACVSELESEVYLDRYLELLEALDGELPVNISVKLSALYSRSKPVGFDESVAVLKKRLRKIYSRAKEIGAFVYVDMEDTTKIDITLEVVQSLLMEDEFRGWADAGIVLQAYLRRTKVDAERILSWVEARGTPISVRLVKGAYWDTETILARLASWPIPVWQKKPESDRTYEDISRFLLSHADVLRPAFASHNLRSLVHSIAVAEQLELSLEAYEFQTLYGMADPIKSVFVKRGVTVREYAPIGDMLTGMAYLVRRLLENTANEGFIRSGFLEGESAEQLLAKPELDSSDTGREYLEVNPKEEFLNVPLLDFSIGSNRDGIREALGQLRQRREGDFPRILPFINGKPVKDCPHFIASDSPEETGFTLGTVGMVGPEHLEQAVEVLKGGFAKWRETNPALRARVLFKAADLIEVSRSELVALIILECGKPWIEADADVAEAIDFCRYYGKNALDLFKSENLCAYDGEEDHHFYEARGICGIISPWNFPLAIPCGMFSAALVTGNAVILKPAEQSTLVASRLFQIFLEAGMPADVGAFLPGEGETIGRSIVQHPEIDTLVFTGSKAVGMDIIREAAVLRKGQTHVKRVIAEMGGKNAIVVDDGADLDQAVKGVLYSAFGYAGQKCSACSRLYVHTSIHDRFIERLTTAVQSLVAGRASDPSVDLGPVIDDDAMKRINGAIASAGLEAVMGRLSADREAGRYIPATLFVEVDPDHKLLQEELFGPVLAAVRVDSFEEGIRLANAHEYGLTGGVFSRHPGHLQYAARHFRVGNLYLNRSCTGALVGRQPFGGFKHSGVGSKAGGPDYLKQFVLPRIVCENTLRQGFAPMEHDS